MVKQSIGFVLVLSLFLSCQKIERPVVRVAVLKEEAALPFVVLKSLTHTKLNWQVNFVNKSQLNNLIEEQAVDMVMLDPISFINLKEDKHSIWGVLALPSSYGLFINNKKEEKDLKTLEVAVEENGISGLLLDLWFGSKTPLHLSVYGNAIRFKLLVEGQVDVAFLGGEEAREAIELGFKEVKASNVETQVELLGYLGHKNEELFNLILADYIEAIKLYNKNATKYNELYYEATSYKTNTEFLSAETFYNVDFYNSLMTLRKLKEPLKNFVAYDQVFWLPKTGQAFNEE